MGLSPEDRARLFQSFSQVDASTSRRFGGTGLGLAISRQLVELMGGRIGVESLPRHGSTFWFVLPLPAALPTPRPPLGHPNLAGTRVAEAQAKHRPRVLLVEDNPVSQMVAARNLEKLGYLVEVAANGLEALDAVDRQSYAMVLMDCQMPEMDGYVATAEIRRREAGGGHLPIIALTAGAMSGDQERALAAGMDDYLAKPLIVEDLAAVVERWVPIPDPVATQTVADGGPVPPELSDTDGRTDGDPADLDPADLDPATVAGLRDVGGTQLLDDLVSLFREDIDRYLDAFAHALADHDPGTLRQASHAFKGSSANLGAIRLAAIAAQIEELGEAGDLEGVRALQPSLATLCRRALDALSEETSQSQSPPEAELSTREGIEALPRPD